MTEEKYERSLKFGIKKEKGESGTKYIPIMVYETITLDREHDTETVLTPFTFECTMSAQTEEQAQSLIDELAMLMSAVTGGELQKQ